MASSAPISGDEALFSAFKKARESESLGFLQIGIDLDKHKFLLLKDEDDKGSHAKNWECIKAVLKEKNHQYFVVRDPMKKGIFILIHWGPDLSPVKQRMIYASSRATLKRYLGNAAFSHDYYINQTEECGVDELIKQRTLHETIDFRTDAEIEKEEAMYDSIPKSTQSAVMQKLPIEMTESGKECVAKYQSKEAKTVFLSLTDTKQSISAELCSAHTIDGIRDALPDKEPRYFLFWHTKVRKDEKDEKGNRTVRVFGYYCPSNADRKRKFTYSTCKTNLIDYFATIKLEIGGKVEFTDKQDFSVEYLDYHVFPKKEEKETFKRVQGPGRKKKNNNKKKKIEV